MSDFQAKAHARRRSAALAGLALAASALAGCAAIQQPLDADLQFAPPAIRECARWFSALDEVVDAADVRDAGAHPIAGFPYLRTDRFTASFAERAAEDEPAFAAWVDRLKELDRTARRYELQNLPEAKLAQLGVAGTAAAAQRTTTCGDRLASDDLARLEARALLLQRAEVPDSYVGWERVLGLYPVASLPFGLGVERWHEEARQTFLHPPRGDRPPVLRYARPGVPADPARIASLLSRAPRDGLGVPQLGQADREMLFETFAPIFDIETTAEHDRFGALAWRDQPSPSVDTRTPIAYRRLAFTRFGGRVVVQLVYAIWFPERPASGIVDLLAGRLDGVVVRVTLDDDGEPLVWDTIHPCGCFHMFFPTRRLALAPPPEPGIEWAFAPADAPTLAASQRLAIRVASGTHYVIQVHGASGGAAIPYAFAEEDTLRALPTSAANTRSAFGSDGIVPGTERGERFVFWPMGVPSSGAMRQWGHHATAFLGRRHFDDPELVARRFVPAGASRRENAAGGAAER